MTPVAESAPTPAPGAEQQQLKRIRRGLKLLTVPIPYLAGLAARVRVSLDGRVPTMGVFASGRLVVNPAFAETLDDSELMFVLAHELLHLALRTHDRARGSHHLEFNYAHDYIINDILRIELGANRVPAGGLDMPGASKRSAEEIVLEMRRNAEIMPSKTAVFAGQDTTVGRLFGPRPSRQAGGAGDQPDAGDVLGPQREKEMFPDDVATLAEETDAMKEAAAAGLALARAVGALEGLRGDDSGAASQLVTALRGLYRTPWEVALQRWMESVAPGERTFVRPSRRGADRSDLVLPGRRREGWMLNVIIDTSGSMAGEIPRALGAIANFCDAAAVGQIRLLQCDVAVTRDEELSPEELAQYTITGYGGSDLTPAMERLAADPQVRAAAIITDGDVQFPVDPMPYEVLWVLPAGRSAAFAPRYGRTVIMEHQS
ncbi:MAG TPA: VWA-like domain-containing protein [Vicinamibacterales bacterium]|nr:VWA-like domain-containing protein [Vicinamibacterales bacterium]